MSNRSKLSNVCDCTFIKLQIIYVLNKLFMKGLFCNLSLKILGHGRKCFNNFHCCVYTISQFTMVQSSLFNLALLTIKSEILNSISNNKITDQFALEFYFKTFLF